MKRGGAIIVSFYIVCASLGAIAAPLCAKVVSGGVSTVGFIGEKNRELLFMQAKVDVQRGVVETLERKGKPTEQSRETLEEWEKKVFTLEEEKRQLEKRLREETEDGEAGLPQKLYEDMSAEEKLRTKEWELRQTESAIAREEDLLKERARAKEETKSLRRKLKKLYAKKRMVEKEKKTLEKMIKVDGAESQQKTGAFEKIRKTVKKVFTQKRTKKSNN